MASKKEIQEVIDRLEEANKRLDEAFEEQNDHCSNLLDQIKNGKRTKDEIKDSS